MHRNKLAQIVDASYEAAEIIDPNPETTETYKEEEEYDKRNEIERLLWRDHQH